MPQNGDLIWEYKREWKEDVTKILPVPSINRNLAIYGNTIIDTSADDYVFALDATSGKLVWENSILGERAPYRCLESPEMKPGAACLTKSARMWGHGWFRATTLS